MKNLLLVCVFLQLAAVQTAAQEPAELANPFLPVLPVTPAAPAEAPPKEFELGPALVQSYRFLLVEHACRVAFQAKTRRELGGPFFKDYVRSIQGLRGWGDGDSRLANYVGHPMQGAIAGYLHIQNSPARLQEFGSSEAYWNSRLKAMLWSAGYSTAFELGPLSEASIGNVGLHPGTSGYVDHVVTPTGGFGMIIGEDAVDRFLIRRWEQGRSDNWRRFLRVAFNPSRAFANVMRGKVPWHRDTRPLRDSEAP